MGKQLISMRVSQVTKGKLTWLADNDRHGTQTEAVAVAVDRLYREERSMVYQYWRHKGSGEIYAVRLEDGVLTGVCGPLHHSEMDRASLSDFDYDANPEDVGWVKEHDSDFALAE